MSVESTSSAAYETVEDRPRPTTPPPSLGDSVEVGVVGDPSETIEAAQEAAPEVAEAPEAPPATPEVEDLVPDPERDEIERLLGDVGNKSLTLSTGSVVNIKPLKLREFLRLLKIITRGGSGVMGSLDFDFNSTEDFVQSLFALVLFAVPEAESETVDFIQSMVEPSTLTGRPETDAVEYQRLAVELENPDLVDMTNIIAVVIRTEGRDLQALGKRLRTMFEVARKMGATPGGPRA